MRFIKCDTCDFSEITEFYKYVVTIQSHANL